MWWHCSSTSTNKDLVILSSWWLLRRQRWCKLVLSCFLWLSRKETFWDWLCLCVCVCQGWAVWSLSHAQSFMRSQGTDSAAKKTIRYFFGRSKRSFQTQFIGSLFALSCSNTVHVLQHLICVFYCLFKMTLRTLRNDPWGMLKAQPVMDRSVRSNLHVFACVCLSLDTTPPN